MKIPSSAVAVATGITCILHFAAAFSQSSSILIASPPGHVIPLGTNFKNDHSGNNIHEVTGSTTELCMNKKKKKSGGKKVTRSSSSQKGFAGALRELQVSVLSCVTNYISMVMVS